MIKIDGNPVYLEGIDDNTPDNYTRRVFNQLLHHQQLSLTNLVAMYNGASTPENKTTTQNISNKLTRNSMKFHDFIELADFAGYDVNFVSRNSRPLGKSSDIRDSLIIPQGEVLKTTGVSFTTLLSEGCAMISGVNFPQILFAGRNADKAAEWVQSQLKEDISEELETIIIYSSNLKFETLAKSIQL